MQFHQTHRIKLKNFGLLCGLFFGSVILIIPSCDQSFEPLQENDRYNFSMAGYLDASADTQWIRVGTVRESIDEAPNPEGINVALEDLQTGETVMMIDSVFTSRNVLNYWTTKEIQTEHSYRVTAEHADGKASSATVTTPSELPRVYITINDSSPTGANIYIDDSVEHVADLQSVWYVTLKSGTETHRRIYRFPLRNKLRYTYAYFGAYVASSKWEEEQQSIEQSIGSAEIISTSRQFFLALAGPEWDENFTTVDDLEYFLDGTASNVENGLGYVVGINSGWFWQNWCLAPNGSKSIPCEPVEPVW